MIDDYDDELEPTPKFSFSDRDRLALRVLTRRQRIICADYWTSTWPGPEIAKKWGLTLKGLESLVRRASIALRAAGIQVPRKPRLHRAQLMNLSRAYLGMAEAGGSGDGRRRLRHSCRTE